jgi:hypothetical protein
MFRPNNINLKYDNFSPINIKKSKLNNTFLNEGIFSELKQNFRLNKLLYYLSQYDPIIDGNINDKYDTSKIKILTKNYYSFESQNKRIQMNLIKKNWSLFKDFNLLLCLFANLDQNTQENILGLYKLIRNKLNRKIFNDVCECGYYIFENYKNISIFNNTKYSKIGQRFVDLRIITYLYFYNYNLMRIKVTKDPIKNTYFRINPYADINSLKLITNIKHINEEIYVWKSNTEKNIIMIFRGTNISVFDSLIRDLRSDTGIFFNKYHNINTIKYGNRFQYSVELYIYLSKLYNDFTFSLAGHSLGGTTVQALNEYINIKNLEISEYSNTSPVKLIKIPYIVYEFNPGMSILNLEKLKKDFYNHNDIDSIYSNIILILSNKTDPISHLNKYLKKKIKIFYINSPEIFKKSKLTHRLMFIDDIRYNILTLYKLYENNSNNSFSNSNLNNSSSHSRLLLNKVFKIDNNTREVYHNKEVIKTLF